MGQTSTQTPTQSPVQGNTQTAPTPQRSTASARTSTSQDVTLVGCVMRSTSPTSSTTIASAGGSEFILSNATMSADAAHPSAPTGSSASTTTASANRAGSTTTGISGQGSGSSFALNGEKDDLSKYVNQRVEIIGHIEGGAVGTTGSANAAAPDAAGASASAEAAKTPTGDRHEGTDAETKAGTTAQAQVGAGGASASAQVGTTGTTRMPRVTVTSVRATSGNCL